MRCIEQCSVRKSYPQLGLHPLRLVRELPANKVSSIVGDGVVVKRVGRLRLPGELNQAREVFLAQKTQDAIDTACVTTCRLYNRPTPTQVIKKKY